MKHNDYTVIGFCKTCGAKIYTPTMWHLPFIKRKGQQMPMPNPKPKYQTCQHPQKKED